MINVIPYTNKIELTEEGRKLKEAFQRYEIRGTPETGNGPPYIAPWYLIDVSTAEIEVNWPGELVAEYDNPVDVDTHFWNIIAEAVKK